MKRVEANVPGSMCVQRLWNFAESQQSLVLVKRIVALDELFHRGGDLKKAKVHYELRQWQGMN